jgi:phosphoribosyl-AMP cyclohydrolase / phosphoribosyl-ATP pyrophosphohydrolase
MTIEQLAQIISERRHASPETSHTAALLAGGVDAAGKKLGEEFAELLMAAKGNVPSATTHEAADVLYHLLVFLEASDTSLTSIYDELEQRHRKTSDPH